MIARDRLREIVEPFVRDALAAWRAVPPDDRAALDDVVADLVTRVCLAYAGVTNKGRTTP